MKKIILAILFGTFLLAAAVKPTYAAGNIFQEFGHTVTLQLQRIYLLLPGNKPGEMVKTQVAEAMQHVNSADTNTVITAQLLNNDQLVANLKLSVSGPFSFQSHTNGEPYKQSLTLVGEATAQGTTLRASTDMRIFDKTLYFKIDELPALPFANLSDIKGKWLKTTTTNTQGMSSDQQQKLREAYAGLLLQSKFDTAVKTIKEDHPVFMIKATIPKAVLAQYMKNVMSILQSSRPGNMAAADAQFQKVIDQVGDVQATFWVDQSSYLIRHLEFPLTYTWVRPDRTISDTPTSQMASPFALLRDVNKVSAVITVDVDKFNESISIDEPTDAQDAKEAFQKAIQPPTVTGMPGSEVIPPSELPKLSDKQRQLLRKYQQMKQVTP